MKYSPLGGLTIEFLRADDFQTREGWFTVHRSLFAALSFALALQPQVAFADRSSHEIAPADEYFGRYKMSILGVRNTLHDVDLRLHANPAIAATVIGMINLTEDAIRDWEKKYPHDHWIPKSLLGLLTVYHDMANDVGHEGEKRVLHWLDEKYQDNVADAAAHNLLKPLPCTQDQFVSAMDPNSASASIECAKVDEAHF